MTGRASPTPGSSGPPPTPGRTNDHTLSFRHKLSQREYPPDCPPLNVRWYYAVDVPKRKPFPQSNAAAKPQKPPSKYIPFGVRDSRAIESAFQKLSEEEDAAEEALAYHRHVAIGDASGDIGEMKTAIPLPDDDVKVPVNEDYLFDVDIKQRELSPVYWLGPVYDVRRGTWFFQDLTPCDENLATQIEEGYLKLKPFRYQKTEERRPRTSNPESMTPKTGSETPTEPPPLALPSLSKGSTGAPASAAQLPTWRLFGAHLNSFVVFVDANTAFLLTDDFYGKLSAAVWQRITAGTHKGGTKVVRGFTEPKPLEKKAEKEVQRSATPPPVSSKAEGEDLKLKRKSMPQHPPPTSAPVPEEPLNSGRASLERKMSSYGSNGDDVQEEMMESEMKEDYVADEGDEPGREIEHLLLATHGIGQKLGLRMESINFTHDVAVLRKTLKSVYSVSPDLQVLNGEVEQKSKNCRIQVLPVCWRHLLDFPKQSLRQNQAEHDLSSGKQEAAEDQYPSLDDITVEGVPAVRHLMQDLALDVLLYQSTTYREHIISTVLTECNRIYALFKERNPNFKGKVSLVGHSLGSAIFFDILCREPDDPLSRPTKRSKHGLERENLTLDFPVENIFCLGSPVGLFQMLKGSKISARVNRPEGTISSPLDSSFSDAFGARDGSPTQNSAFLLSAPKCGQLFNIFHPADPISYRIEPLVSKAMAELKAQPLPYTKRGLFSANGQIVGGISGIGQSVTRTVTGMWSSLSSTIASTMINRSLGFSDTSATSSQISANAPGDDDKMLKDPLHPVEGEHPPTMIDAEIETLFAGFQRQRKAPGEDGKEDVAERYKIEENKVRALNSTGRIDFSIQEGVFDISLLASIASHLSYWGDEDVNHFVISQLLSRSRVLKRKAPRRGDEKEEWSMRSVQ